jgi:hypothetical protein
MSLFTRTRSPTISVFSIDGDGISYTWMMKILISTVKTMAAAMIVSISRAKLFFFFGVPRAVVTWPAC